MLVQREDHLAAYSVPSVAGVASDSPNERAATFPTAAFADIRDDPVSEEAATEFQAILSEAFGRGGMTGTVMSANGIWGGAAGTSGRRARHAPRRPAGDRQRQQLGAAPPTVIAFGSVTYRLALRHLPSSRYARLAGVTHYSHYVSREEYRKRVLAHLSLKSD